MKTNHRRQYLKLLFGFALTCLWGLSAQSIFAIQEKEFSAADLEFFESSVRPLLVENCHECHGPNEQEAGLRLDIRDAILQGGDTGAAIDLEDPSHSLLIEAVEYEGEYQMPPDSKLPDQDIAILRDWVKRGAPWPKENKSANPADAEFNLEERRASHWCWQPPTRQTIPSVKGSNWAREDIDRFVLAKLEAAGLAPADDASRSVLLRRVFFDLIGLPPTTADIEAFLADESDGAFAKVVDRLLASPRFGEHWARKWMDLTRYAETYGHEFDYPIEHAYKYRDYLIRAFNANVPFNNFAREHIAGDLLQNPRLNPNDLFNESIIGTGFWFLGEGTHGPVDVKGDEAGRIDNQIDVMTKTFLGVTVSCARCHDHKFDAISTEDYYALAGFLQSSRRQLAYLDPHETIATKLREISIAEREAELRFEASGFILNIDRQKLASYLAASIDYLRTFDVNQHVLQGEKLKSTNQVSGVVEVQKIEPENNFSWQGNQQLWWRDGKINETLDIEFDVPEKNAGSSELVVRLTKANDYGIVKIWLDERATEAVTVDCFAAELTTASIVIGRHELSPGKHKLHFQITGANETAIKRYMLGLDYLAWSKETNGVEKISSAEWMAKRSNDQSLDQALLQRWIDTLRHDSINRPSSPLFAIKKLVESDGDQDAVQSLKDLLNNKQKIAAEQNQKLKQDSILFADFSKGIPDDWFATGLAFEKLHDSNKMLNANAELELTSVASSNRLANRLAGSLRSPTFEITGDQVLYHYRGENIQVRIVIDGFMLDTFNGLLFGDMTKTLPKSDDYRWAIQSGDLRNYKGHRAYIEINDLGEGWAAIDEIRFASGQPEIEEPNPLNSTIAEWANSANAEDIVNAAVNGLSGFLPEAMAKLDCNSVNGLNWILRNQLEPSFTTTTVPTAISSSSSSVPRKVNLENDWRVAFEKCQSLAQELPLPERVIAMCDGSPEDEFVFIRGNHKTPGSQVPRRSLSAFHDADRFAKLSGSGRLEFAEELVSPSHPLTSRVIVNRLWHHLFGVGIVPTVDNLGVLGEAPTHPELLDYLALEFIDAKWSIKDMLRRIVLTRTYQLSSQPNAKAAAVDPANRLLHSARIQRLTGEEIRDSILQVSEELRTEMYGPSVAVHLTPFMQGRGRPGNSGPLDGNGRRSVYLEVRRNFLNPMMLAFDTPIPFNSAGARNVSNVPAQALILMNSPFVQDQAQKWATRVLSETSLSDRERISGMILSGLGRTATAAELDECEEFLRDALSQESAGMTRDEAWGSLAHIIFNMKAFTFVY